MLTGQSLAAIVAGPEESVMFSVSPGSRNFKVTGSVCVPSEITWLPSVEGSVKFQRSATSSGTISVPSYKTLIPCAQTPKVVVLFSGKTTKGTGIGSLLRHLGLSANTVPINTHEIAPNTSKNNKTNGIVLVLISFGSFSPY